MKKGSGTQTAVIIILIVVLAVVGLLFIPIPSANVSAPSTYDGRISGSFVQDTYRTQGTLLTKIYANDEVNITPLAQYETAKLVFVTNVESTVNGIKFDLKRGTTDPNLKIDSLTFVATDPSGVVIAFDTYKVSETEVTAQITRLFKDDVSIYTEAMVENIGNATLVEGNDLATFNVKALKADKDYDEFNLYVVD